jgi:uncharacterized protein
LSIPVGAEERVSAVICTPDSEPDDKAVGVIIAHGAGNDMHEPLIVTVCEGLADAGHVTLRFNFVYREKGQKPRTPRQNWKPPGNPYIPFSPNLYLINSKESLWEENPWADEWPPRWRPPGNLQPMGLSFWDIPCTLPEKKRLLRDSHLYEMNIPMLFFAGTRDTLCDLSPAQRSAE